MHPNAFLKSSWRNEILDQVFVAMSFERRYIDRFNKIIKPAIEAEKILGISLKAFRVDNSKTGDSIVTEIVNGIAHSRLILADVSVIDKGKKTKIPFRNSNVLYEVGIALSCRNSSEVLLIRDDSERFLFDISTIPHMKIDFSDCNTAIILLRNAIADRLSETKLIEDSRIKIAAETLTQDEIRILVILSQLPPNQACELIIPNLGMMSLPDERGLDGLIRKGCIKSIALNTQTGSVYHCLNEFGYALMEIVNDMPKLTPDTKDKSI